MSATSTAAAAASTKVASQGGILDGANPSTYKPADPIVLFIIQAGIIISFCRLLHWPLSKIRQPRVIAEVIGGILLGPTVCGRIPGFTKAIFPLEGMPVLTFAANLGLVLFLFIVGLEVDLRLISQNWKIALSVGAGGMALPFGLGAALAVGLYKQFGHDVGTKHIDFGIYLLFVGVALSITAFPVLARILTELKLLQNNVGVIVLSAGVGNDVIGWILLALTVALVNAGTGLTALWVLLTGIGWILFLVYAVRPVFIWLLRRSGSLDSRGPTQGMVCLTLVLALASAFFTDVIGIHAIFGAFLVGLICPHEGGFAVRLTEKIEDVVSVLLLPIYFALSGLHTNISLLDTGEVWAYVIAILAVAFIGKIGGGTIAARLNGLLWRESFTIGCLMSCKGLVELIVLNIGLQAGIISPRVFTMFVVMALITTFATTPLTLWLYPVPYRRKVEMWRRGEIDWDGIRLIPDTVSDADKARSTSISRVTVLLRLDSLPSLLTFINLLKGEQTHGPTIVHKAKETTPSKEEIAPATSPDSKFEIHGLRLLEIGERNSAVMRVAEEHEFSERDPVVNVFRAFGRLNNFACAAGLSLVPEDSFAEVLSNKAKDTASDLLVIPWSENGAMHDSFEQMHVSTSVEHRFTHGPHTQFISSILNQATCNTAIFINKGFGGSLPEDRRTLTRKASIGGMSGISRTTTGLIGADNKPILPIMDPSHHVFFPFIGGADDRAALRFVLRMVKNSNVTATISHVVETSSHNAEAPKIPTTAVHATDSGDNTHLAVENQASVIRGSISSSVEEQDHAFYMQIAENLPEEYAQRVVFETLETSQPLAFIIKRAKEEVGLKPNNAGDLVIVGRSHGESSHGIRGEVAEFFSSAGHSDSISSETRNSLGDVAEAVLVADLKASLLVFKAFTSEDPKAL